jgi:hypothetical protein
LHEKFISFKHLIIIAVLRFFYKHMSNICSHFIKYLVAHPLCLIKRKSFILHDWLATVIRKSAICSHGWRILQMLRLPSMSTEKSKSLAGILVLNFKNCYSSSIEFYESHSTKLLTNGFFFVDSWNRMFFLCSSHFYSWRGRRNKGKSQSLRPVLNLNAAVVTYFK